jgi:hypothetical protein
MHSPLRRVYDLVEGVRGMILNTKGTEGDKGIQIKGEDNFKKSHSLNWGIEE